VRHSTRSVGITTLIAAALCAELGAAPPVFAQSVDQLIPHRVHLEPVEYLGKRAVKVTEDAEVPNGLA
jgi:hypothetical protein